MSGSPLWDQMKYQDGKLPIDRLRRGEMSLAEAVRVAAVGVRNEIPTARNLGHHRAVDDFAAHADLLDEAAAMLDHESEIRGLPSLPWTWTGGYPQRITGPDATLIAKVYESPDVPASVAPIICKAVNTYFGIYGAKTYPEEDALDPMRAPQGFAADGDPPYGETL